MRKKGAAPKNRPGLQAGRGMLEVLYNIFFLRYTDEKYKPGGNL